MVPDMHGARMMAYGETLRPTLADCLALLPVLQPLFADAGFVLDAPDPSRWYLRLPIDLALPEFDNPDEVLGDDLFSHLPEGEGGRRWRALMTEAQVLLHNHSWNQQRVAQGQQPINSLWFWGGGVMPVSVSTAHAQVRSRDALLQGLALAAGVAVDGEQAVDALVDLRQLRSSQQLGNEAIRPLLAALKEKGVDFGHVTLHVGAGTFQPVRADDLKDHVMHREWLNVGAELVQQVRRTRAAGGRVIGVGTTVVPATRW
ncbi:hypothetical protein G6F63_013417 [Rhizopus arrhizus]|nr:hypothetical protein G6F63_013417 [Rhizopus arrhizus]